MNIEIKGRYNITFQIQGMFLNEKITYSGENIITLLGESFFLNRGINNAFNPISYIVLGNGGNIPSKDDTTLGNETIRRRCNSIADLNNKRIILTAKFKAKEILGTSEIGVANDKILISHDRYPKYTNDQLVGFNGDVNVEYIFQFSLGFEKTGWTESSNDEGLYYIPEENIVVGVIENGDSGYRKVNSLSQLRSVRGAYYYDYDSKNLYIHPIDEDSLNHEIIIQTR